MSSYTHKSLQHLKQLCDQHLRSFVRVESYEFAPCYLWYDRPLYDDFGDQIQWLRGNTIYLYDQSTSLDTDLFHELGHLVGRKCNLISHKENGYGGSWQQANEKLIAQVSEQRHWSDYLNAFAQSQPQFRANAGSELWAELFMLWHLHPDTPEAQLIDPQMQAHNSVPLCAAIKGLADVLKIRTKPAG